MSRASFLLLRVALAFAFLYPAYGFWQNPRDWIGYIPAFVKNVGLPAATETAQAGLSQDVLLLALAGFHLIIALWILSGWRIFLPSLVAAIFLGSVVYFNFNQLDILFRDISLALAALSLAFHHRR